MANKQELFSLKYHQKISLSKTFFQPLYFPSFACFMFSLCFSSILQKLAPDGADSRVFGCISRGGFRSQLEALTVTIY